MPVPDEQDNIAFVFPGQGSQYVGMGKALFEASQAARRIFQQPAIKKYVVREAAPGDAVQSDADIEKYLRVSAFTGKHPSGTCKMGVDEMAVVDPQLRVRGVEGLRVVDASVMPVIPGGNTNAPTMMVAERASDLIKGRTPALTGTAG